MDFQMPGRSRATGKCDFFRTAIHLKIKKPTLITTMFQFTEDVNDVVPMTKAAAAAQAAQAVPSKPASASPEPAALAAPPPVAAPTVLSDADAEFDASMYSTQECRVLDRFVVHLTCRSY
jgi:hypothetical protein